MTHRLRDLLGLAAAVAACIAVVAAPTLARPKVPAAGPVTLAGVWPHAHVFDIPGVVLSGTVYEPQAIITTGVSIGTATSADGNTISLVQVTSTHTPAQIRLLQAGLPASATSYDAFAVTQTNVYVMRSSTDRDGIGHESLWRMPQPAGSPVLMTADAGQALFQGSINDLQIAGHALRWVASTPDDPSTTQLRSIPLTGGATHVQALHGQYILSTYPMLYSSDPTNPPTLADSRTGNVTAVHAARQAGTICDPLWCVLQGSNTTGGTTLTLSHPDGTAPHRLGDANSSLITTDPTMLDRFVALSERSPAMDLAPNPTAQLWLYDIRTHTTVEITAAASTAFAAGRWLWWSTGDNETLTWHALDLVTLH